eukprot:scaffold140523_cov30-Tisochrysis_lutea.AAC.2
MPFSIGSFDHPPPPIPLVAAIRTDDPAAAFAFVFGAPGPCLGAFRLGAGSVRFSIFDAACHPSAGCSQDAQRRVGAVLAAPAAPPPRDRAQARVHARGRDSCHVHPIKTFPYRVHGTDIKVGRDANLAALEHFGQFERQLSHLRAAARGLNSSKA